MYTLLHFAPFLFLLYTLHAYIFEPLVKRFLSPSTPSKHRITQNEAQTSVDDLNTFQRKFDIMKHNTHTSFAESLSFSGKYNVNTDGNMLLVTSCSVGAKFGFLLERIDDNLEACAIAGADTVNECINRNVAHGGRPLFFSPSVESGMANDESMTLLSAMANACKKHECPMIGGNFTESPDMGWCLSGSGTLVSATTSSTVLNGSRINEGDLVYGIASSSPHSSEYGILNIVYPITDTASIVRYPELLARYDSTFQELYPLTENAHVHGIVHMCAGGWDENIMRLVGNRGLYAEWTVFKFSPLYMDIQERTNMGREDMLKTFSCGFSALVVVSPDNECKNYTDKWTLVGEIKSL